MKETDKKERIIKEYPIEISPFAARTKVKAKFDLKEIQNSDSDVVLARKRTFQSNEYTKLIINPELNLSVYYKLSSLAKTLLFYIAHSCLEYNTPTFELKVQDFKILIKLKSSNKVYNAIGELIFNDYIAKTDTRSIYWINHNLYYKGNFLIVKELKIRKREEYLREFGIK